VHWSQTALVAANSSALPVWANVVIGLVGGGAVGGIVTSLIQSRSKSKEEWRTRMLSVADDFAQGFWLAHAQLWSVLDLSYKVQGGQLNDEIDLSQGEHELLLEAAPLLRDVLLKLARIALLFGSESAAASAAGEARNKLRDSYNSLDPQPDYPFSDTSRAQDRLNESEHALERFSTAARSAAISARARS
jgi:hypothetical protein